MQNCKCFLCVRVRLLRAREGKRAFVLHGICFGWCCVRVCSVFRFALFSPMSLCTQAYGKLFLIQAERYKWRLYHSEESGKWMKNNQTETWEQGRERAREIETVIFWKVFMVLLTFYVCIYVWACTLHAYVPVARKCSIMIVKKGSL